MELLILLGIFVGIISCACIYCIWNIIRLTERISKLEKLLTDDEPKKAKHMKLFEGE